MNLDRKRRAANAATNIKAHLADGNLKEAWCVAKGWYRTVDDIAPKTCYESMEKQTAEKVKLYEKVEPPGEPIPINVKPFVVPDAAPEDSEIRAAVKDGLKWDQVGCALLFKAKHIKQWLKDMEEGEKSGQEGLGDKWKVFVRLITLIWETGAIPTADDVGGHCPVAHGRGDFREIGLLEPFWKVLEIIMDHRLQVFGFHDCLHGFVNSSPVTVASQRPLFD